MSKAIGIVREVYTKWERRVPLSPLHVSSLIQKGIPVYIQPCHRRIYSDNQYEASGATLTDDLSKASIILGVKALPAKDILKKKTYLFFSHTIKGQNENMELLDTIVASESRFLDYECIQKNGKRSIAFGEYAGRAGMINTLRGLGEKALSLGYSTPFLNIASTYTYGELKYAKAAIHRAGDDIKKNGLPSELKPMTFVFTGNGNVSKGAQEIFQCLPHEMITPQELPHVDRNRNVLYGCIATETELVEHLTLAKKGVVDKLEYYQYPDRFQPIFHRDILPHTSVLMNCMYWDARFPRLITSDQMNEITDCKLLCIGDITCDIRGSIEFLSRSTEIETPFYVYDPIQRTTSNDTMNSSGIFMMGVDILPSELPIESSCHFGTLLLPLLETLLDSDGQEPLVEQERILPAELYESIIAANGKLTPNFEYIQKLRSSRISTSVQENANTCLLLNGHLFDSGLINRFLNTIEIMGGAFHIDNVNVRPNTTTAHPSSVIVQVSMPQENDIEKLISTVTEMCMNEKDAAATVTQLPHYCNGNYSKTESIVRSDSRKDSASILNYSSEHQSVTATQNDTGGKHVLCLGAGLVVSPLLEYLSRTPSNTVTVVSGKPNEAENLAAILGRKNVLGTTLDAIQQGDEIKSLCANSDCVVSLLPAPMHLPVAEYCLEHATPLVTASYISPEMKALHGAAIERGIPILCEMGLDPGMDHMSAMQVIHDVQSQGGTITSFSSVCGGLPAPENADNPLAYKFSWSPRGVLTAAQNAARYRKDGVIVEVSGDEMLSSSRNVHFLPAFSLEELPNRDSIPYGELYGISDSKTVFRGTLRYAGWSNIMYQCKKIGLLDASSEYTPSDWSEIMKELHRCHPTIHLDEPAKTCLKWLGVYNTSPASKSPSLMDSFCTLLQEKLAYGVDERDMAIMHHEFKVEYHNSNKSSEKRTSTYIGYGTPKESIMAKTVGVTAAIGVKMILDGDITETGVFAPISPEIYQKGLGYLSKEGITFKEKIHKV